MNLSRGPAGPHAAGGGHADSPDIDIEDDGSFAWVVYRQDFGGVSRTVGRRLVGSQFEAPEFIDGGASADEPKVDMSGARRRLRGRAGRRRRAGLRLWLDHDHFQPGGRLDSVDGFAPTKPEIAAPTATTSRSPGGTGADGNSVARARYKETRTARSAASSRSRAAISARWPIRACSSAATASATSRSRWSRARPGARTLTVAVFDRPPGAPFIESSEAYKRKTRPELRWRPGLELWGAQTFRVYMDGVVIGQTTNDTLVPATPLTPGKHTWQVEAVDRAGQTTRSRVRTLKIDSIAPTLKVSVSGKRAAGQALKITVTATDTGGVGDGPHHRRLRRPARRRRRRPTTRHRYKRGKFTLKVAAVDKAGNVTRKQVKLRIKKS